MALQDEILNITTDTNVPAASLGVGNVSTKDEYFASVSADNNLQLGDYLVDASGNSRKIIQLSADKLNGKLESAFPSDIPTSQILLIRKDDCKIYSMGIAADEGSDTTVNGKILKSGSSINFSSPTGKDAQGTGFVKPKYIEGASAGACTVVIERHRN